MSTSTRIGIALGMAAISFNLAMGQGETLRNRLRGDTSLAEQSKVPVSVRRAASKWSYPCLEITQSHSLRLPAVDNAHQPVVTAIALDPRSEVVAVAGDDHAIHLLNRESLKVQQTLLDHSDWVRTLAFDSGGYTLASAGVDGRVILWKRGPEWKQRQVLPGAPALWDVKFAPGSDIIGAVGFDAELFLFGRDVGKRIPMLCDCEDLRSVDFTEDGSVVCTGGRSGSLHWFDVQNMKALGHEEVHSRRIRSLCFVGKSRRVCSVGEDGMISVFDTATGQQVYKAFIPGCKLFSVAEVSDSVVAIGGSDNLIRLVDLSSPSTTRLPDGRPTARLVARLLGHQGSIDVLACDGKRLYSGSFDTTLRVWNISQVAEGDRIATESGAGSSRTQ